MTIKINDSTLTLSEGATLIAALNVAQITLNGIAVAVNSNVIPAGEYGQTMLNDGDSVIIIKAFYGG